MDNLHFKSVNADLSSDITQSYIGTSGYVYDWWFSKTTDAHAVIDESNTGFYPKNVTSKKALSYYASQFTSVEINNTFYKLPSVATVKEWYNTTPKDFRFVVKFSKFATTNKKLVNFDLYFKEFFAVVKHLKEKLVGILVQLPPSFVFGDKKSKVDGLTPAERVLNVGEVAKRVSPSIPIFIEFRHDTWFTQKGVEIVKEAKLSMVFVSRQHTLQPSLVHENITLKGHVYLRFHGPGQRLYTGNYSDEYLCSLSKESRRLASKTYFMFDNTDSFACEVNNATGILDRTLLKQYKLFPSAIIDAKKISTVWF